MIRIAGWLVVGWAAFLSPLAVGSVKVWAEDAVPAPAPAKSEAGADAIAGGAAASSANAAAAAGATASNAASEPSAEQIRLWIKDLDSEKFATREQASQHLSAAGGAAVEAVAAAVDGKSREVSMRAIQILEQLYRTGNVQTKDKCRAALEKIAQNADSPAATKAAEILKPQSEPAQNGPAIFVGPAGAFAPRIQFGGGPPGGVPIGNLQVQIIGGNMQAGNVQMRMQNVNGRRTMDATEGDRKVHIEDDPQTGIDMKVTEKVDGKEKTTQYTAKNLDELKKNHPAAEALYQKYMGNNRAGAIQLRLQGQNIALPGGLIPPNAPFQPAPAAQAPAQPAPAPQAAAAQLKPADEIAAARKLLADVKQQVAKTAAGKPDADLQKALEQLQAADERLAEAETKAAQ